MGKNQSVWIIVPSPPGSEMHLRPQPFGIQTILTWEPAAGKYAVKSLLKAVIALHLNAEGSSQIRRDIKERPVFWFTCGQVNGEFINHFPFKKNLHLSERVLHAHWEAQKSILLPNRYLPPAYLAWRIKMNADQA